MFAFEKEVRAPATIETTPHESRVEKLFEDDVTVINEGQKGVILFVDDGVYRKYVDDTRTANKDVAFKLLKVGNEADLIQEITVHKKALDVLRASNFAQGEYAYIPEIVFERAAIHPRGKLLEWSQKNRRNLSDEKILMFAMDFIPGKTIGEILLQEILSRHPDSSYRGRTGGLDMLPYTSLESAAEALFGVHGNKYVLMDRAMEYLSQTDFVLPRKVSSQIARTLGLLNSAGVFHRDLHWGNIMVTDWGLPSVQTHIIDFGDGIVSQHESEFLDDQRGFISDTLSVGRYIELSTNRKRLAENLIQKMKKNTEWVSAVEDISVAMRLGRSAVESQLQRQWYRLNNRSLFLGMLQVVMEKNDERGDFILACHEFANQMQLADSNKIHEFLRLFEN